VATKGGKLERKGKENGVSEKFKKEKRVKPQVAHIN